MALNAHELWAIPEQSLAPPTPTELPLSRWIAHIESADIPCSVAKSVSAWASTSWVTSAFFGSGLVDDRDLAHRADQGRSSAWP